MLQRIAERMLLTCLVTLSVATSGCGSAKSVDEDVDQLSERVAVLEALSSSSSDAGAGGSADGATLDERVSALEQITETLSAQSAAQASLADRLSAIEERQAEVDDELGALNADVTALSDDLASSSSGGGVWFDEGSGAGTCARVNVVTTSSRPLVVMATVELDLSGEVSLCQESSGSYSCTAFASTYPSEWQLSGQLAVHAENVGGATFSSDQLRTFTHGWSRSGIGNLSSYSNIIQFDNFESSAVESISTVIELPSAGSYTVEAQVSGTAPVGTCRLVVLQH